MEIFCNSINVFNVPFDEFNVFLLNKSINFLKKTKKKLNSSVYCLKIYIHMNPYSFKY